MLQCIILHPQILVILQKTHGSGYEEYCLVRCDPNSLINIYQLSFSSTLKEAVGLKKFSKFLPPCTACTENDDLNILSIFH
jgi:hypothetical protein